MTSQKSKKTLFEEYIKTHQLEKLISELTNSLVHSLSPNPIVYMIKYLTGLLTEEEKTENNINIPPPYPEGVPIVKFPKFQSNNLLSKYLNKENWNDFKYIKTRYNNNINDLTILSENFPNDNIGICLCDDDCIISYDDLLNDIICYVHNIKKNLNKEYYKVNTYHKLENDDLYFLNNVKENLIKVCFEFNRNIDGYTFNNINRNNFKLKEDLEKEIDILIQENIIDNNIKKIENFRNFDNEIVKKEFELIKNLGFENDNYTDKDRSIYSNPEQSIIILINFSNHLKLIISNESNESKEIIKCFDKGINIIKNISFSFQFCVSNYGYITSEIPLLGAGFKIHSMIHLNNIDKCKEIIENSKFYDYSIRDNILYSNQNFLLSDINEIYFIIKYFSKILGISRVGNSEIQFDLKKIDFKEKNSPITLAYNSSFDEIKYIISSNGRNINSILSYYILNEKENYPILYDKHEYYLFYSFISKLILNSQKFDTEEFNHISKPENPRNIINLSEEEIKKIKNMNIILIRNIKNSPFPCNNLYLNFVKEFEEKLKNQIEEINKKEQFVTYYNINSNDAQNIIKENNIQLEYDKLKELLNIKEINEYRGLLKFEKPNIIGLINDIDHLKIIYNIDNPNINISKGMTNLIKIINELSKIIRFEYDDKLGFFTSDPNYIGTGMKIKFNLIINKLNESNLNEWVKDKGYIWKKINDNEIEFQNILTIGLSETEMLANLLFYIHDIINLDK